MRSERWAKATADKYILRDGRDIGTQSERTGMTRAAVIAARDSLFQSGFDVPPDAVLKALRAAAKTAPEVLRIEG